jgi:hypothetical protein
MNYIQKGMKINFLEKIIIPGMENLQSKEGRERERDEKQHLPSFASSWSR